MALLWSEGFDCYGTTLAAMGLRGYAYAGGNFGLVQNATNARTGLGYYNINGGTSGGNSGVGKVLDAPTDVLGQGIGIKVTQNGAASNNNPSLRFGGGTYNGISVSPTNNLGFAVYQGNTLLDNSTVNIYTMNSWGWLEVKCTKNSTGLNTGIVELRWQNEPFLTINNVNITTQFDRCGIGQPGGGFGNGNSNVQFDDWIIWDNSGTRNNDFLSDRRCETSGLSADGAGNQWVPSTGTTGYNLLTKTTPSDTSYVQAVNAGDISEFAGVPIGVDTNDIAGVQLVGRVLKTDSGTSTMRLGMHSGAFVTNGPTINPGVSATLANLMLELDPNGNIPWTKAALDAAWRRITRDT